MSTSTLAHSLAWPRRASALALGLVVGGSAREAVWVAVTAAATKPWSVNDARIV